MKNYKLVLQEDDCAPDAREYFIKRMREKFHLIFADFHELGMFKEPNDLCMQWYLDGYLLEYNGDDPFYRLYKKKINNS
jgi:hypothetical protein